MSLNSFSIVFAGANFPVSSIKTSDFVFRHREMAETVRLPVLLQASAGGASIDVLNERFIATVTVPDKIDVQIPGLQDLAQTFLEYAGKRTINAIGHNMQFSLDDLNMAKEAVVDHFVRKSAVQEALGSPSFGADLQFAFEGDNQSRVRVAIVTSGVDAPTVDFNFNFEADAVAPDEALKLFRTSFERAESIVDNIRKAIESEVSV